MQQYAALATLPSAGPLLGAAYDRAVMTLIRSWRVVTIFLAFDLLISIVPGVAQSSLVTLVLFGWTFSSMAISIRAVFDAEYRMTNRSAGEMFATQLMIALTVLAVNFMAIAAFVQPGGNAQMWLLAVPGIIVGSWLWARWSCGPVLGARGVPAIKALDQSWRLTASAFWPTLVIWGANFVVTYALPSAINYVAAILMYQRFSAIPSAAVTIVASVVVFVAQLYAIQARNISECMWLKALEGAQPAEIAAPI